MDTRSAARAVGMVALAATVLLFGLPSAVRGGTLGPTAWIGPGLATERAILTGSDGAPGYDFGSRMSLDGADLLVGANWGAYVFTNTGGTWTESAKIGDPHGDVAFSSVALSGDTALVGDGHVFVRVGGTWSHQATLTPSDPPSPTDYFGCATALLGDTALVGEMRPRVPGWSGSGGPGEAHVFVRSGGTWSEQARLAASDSAAYTLEDLFGGSVSLATDTALVGAGAKDSSRGAAYVFVRSAGKWSEQAKLLASDGVAGDYFGVSVSLSGDTALVGAQAKDSRRGAAYVFVRSGGAWSQQAKLAASDGRAPDLFGHEVHLRGDRALVTAPNRDSTRGAAYVFTRTAGNWSQRAKLVASDGSPSDCMGHGAALDGDTAMGGAPWRGSRRGAVYVFDLGAPTVLPRSFLGTPWLRPVAPRRNRYFLVRGSVTRHPAARAAVRLYFYRRIRTTWRYHRHVTVRTPTGSESYRLRYKLPYAGRWYVRAYHKDGGHRAGWGKAKVFKVR